MTSLLRSTFSSPSLRVLLVGAERAILYLFESGTLVKAYIFSADESGLAQFDRGLAELPPAPVCVLVDIVEEEYRQETIPHLGGADRKAVLERKYARLFRGTPYHHALRQGRETEGRRDDRVLLTAITRPELVLPWLERLLAHKTPIAGIYSLPVLSERLLKRIGVASSNVLLISLQKASGLRQSFFRDGQLKISRLAYVPRLGSVPFAAHLMGEVEKLRRYLNSLALISSDGPLSIYILSHGQLLTELEQHCRDTDQEKFYLLDVAELNGRLGSKGAGQTHYSDLLFASLLASKALPNHYARREETQYYALHRMRIALASTSLVLLLGSAAWSGINFIEGMTFKQQALDAEQKAGFYQQRYELARGKLPATPVEPRAIKTAVDAVGVLRRLKSSPEPLLRLVSGVLDTQPEVQLDQIDWATTHDAAGEVPAKGRGRTAPRSLVGAGDVALFQVAELSGHLAPFDGDYGRAIALIDRLAAQLRAAGGVTAVEVVEYPLDVRSEASVSGSATAAGVTQDAAFRMKVIMGAGDGGRQG